MQSRPFFALPPTPRPIHGGRRCAHAERHHRDQGFGARLGADLGGAGVGRDCRHHPRSADRRRRLRRRHRGGGGGRRLQFFCSGRHDGAAAERSGRQSARALVVVLAAGNHARCAMDRRRAALRRTDSAAGQRGGIPPRRSHAVRIAGCAFAAGHSAGRPGRGPSKASSSRRSFMPRSAAIPRPPPTPRPTSSAASAGGGSCGCPASPIARRSRRDT